MSVSVSVCVCVCGADLDQPVKPVSKKNFFFSISFLFPLSFIPLIRPLLEQGMKREGRGRRQEHCEWLVPVGCGGLAVELGLV